MVEVVLLAAVSSRKRRRRAKVHRSPESVIGLPIAAPPPALRPDLPTSPGPRRRAVRRPQRAAIHRHAAAERVRLANVSGSRQPRCDAKVSDRALNASDVKAFAERCCRRASAGRSRCRWTSSRRRCPSATVGEALASLLSVMPTDEPAVSPLADEAGTAVPIPSNQELPARPDRFTFVSSDSAGLTMPADSAVSFRIGTAKSSPTALPRHTRPCSSSVSRRRHRTRPASCAASIGKRPAHSNPRWT